jgi:hypothetical protein
MPSREHRSEHDADLAATPAFLQAGAPGPAASGRGDAGGERENQPSEHAARRQLTIPRPVTPSTPAPTPAPTGIDPASLPMPTLSRRRLVTAAGVIVASLLALSFLHQVSAATDAANRAADLRAGNAVLQDEVARLQRDLGHVQDPRYILLAGRAYGLGGPHEIPFALAAGAAPLPADAPGSASVRLGAPPLHRNPLDVWLEVLFGART